MIQTCYRDSLLGSASAMLLELSLSLSSCSEITHPGLLLQNGHFTPTWSCPHGSEWHAHPRTIRSPLVRSLAGFMNVSVRAPYAPFCCILYYGIAVVQNIGRARDTQNLCVAHTPPIHDMHFVQTRLHVQNHVLLVMCPCRITAMNEKL